MLGDLRDQLAPIGQVRVLESVGEKALDYFETLDDADLTEAALLRKSRALYQIGDVYLQLGDFSSARGSFQVSLEQVRRLWEAQPDDAERLFELSQAEYWAGFAAWNAGEFVLAEQHLQAYFDTAWMLHERDPTNPGWLMETVWAGNNLGSLAFSRSLFPKAKGHFENAIERIDLLITMDDTPEWRFERSTIYSWLGSTHYHLGEFQDAKRSFLSALDRVSDTSDAFEELERAYQLGWLSDIELELGDLKRSRAHAEEAITIASVLAQADRDSTDFLFAQTAHGRRIARLDYYEGREVDFISLHQSASKLLESDDPPPSWRLLAMDVADIGIQSGGQGALEWARALLDMNPIESGRNDALQRPYLSLSASLARHDPDGLSYVRDALPIVLQQFESTNDIELAAPLMKAFELMGDNANAAKFRAIRKSAGSAHPEIH